MANVKDEALKMAIKLMKEENLDLTDAYQACKEALEQPAQEYLTRAQQVIRANNSAQEPEAWIAKAENDSKCYSAWRKWEGYQIPATGEGEKQMSERWKAFKAGWFAKEKNNGN